MRHYFLRRMQWFLLMGALMCMGGCANMMEAMPAPPAFLAPIDLQGPYDADIPIREANQIKSASLMQDWAVPYIFIHVATHFESVGDQERSVHFFNRAIDESRKRNNTLGEGSAVSRKVAALIHFGNLPAAYHVVEEQNKKWSAAPFNAFVLYNYGYYHLQSGAYVKAQEYFGQALAANLNYSDAPDLTALRRDTELGYGMALVLADYFRKVSGGLCLTDFDQDFYQDIRRNISEGVGHLEQVQKLNDDLLKTKIIQYYPEMIPSFVKSDMHNYLGLAFGIQGQLPRAVANMETARRLAQRANYHLGEADGIFFLNQVYLLDENRSEGIKAAQALAEIADRYQLVSYSIWANMILAHHYKATGDIDRTIQAMNKALKLMEENGSWLSRFTDFRGIGFFHRQAIYQALLDLQNQKNDKREAFKTAGRAKSVMLADLLSGELIGKTPAALTLMQQLQIQRERMAEGYNRLLSAVNGSIVFMDTAGKIDKARRAYDDLLTAIKAEDEFLYSLISVFPPEAGDIQKLLDDNTTLFTYYVGEQYLSVWVISKNKFHQEKIIISRKDVDRLAQAYRSAMMSRDKSQADALAEKAYDMFLKPVIPFVYGDMIGVVPHGPLFNLPFASLRYVKAYLVDGFTVFYLPHLGMLKSLLTKKMATDAKPTMILDNAQCVVKQQSILRNAAEMNMLKRIFPQAEYFEMNDPAKDCLKKIAGGYDIIHFVRNVYPTGKASLDSCMLADATLRSHGCLSVRDLFRLQLNGRTTMFGARRTEWARASWGEGISAWESAWLYAVSPQIVTQLWEVEDKSRAALLEMFYKNLGKSGNAADALREAQKGMIQKGYGPSDWAAFILTGRY